MKRNIHDNVPDYSKLCLDWENSGIGDEHEVAVIESYKGVFVGYRETGEAIIPFGNSNEILAKTPGWYAGAYSVFYDHRFYTPSIKPYQTVTEAMQAAEAFAKFDIKEALANLQEKLAKFDKSGGSHNDKV